MTYSDPIGLWLVASFASGLATHVVLAVWDRRAYRRLRDAYVGAVTAAQQTGAAEALVRAQELHREFMRTTAPGWLSGLGARVRSALVLCAVTGVAVMVATGRLPPIVPGVAVLFAIGLRRILLATALLLAVFVATSVLSPPRSAQAPRAHLPAAHVTSKAPSR